MDRLKIVVQLVLPALVAHQCLLLVLLARIRMNKAKRLANPLATALLVKSKHQLLLCIKTAGVQPAPLAALLHLRIKLHALIGKRAILDNIRLLLPPPLQIVPVLPVSAALLTLRIS
jgi:hypothetical protein